MMPELPDVEIFRQNLDKTSLHQTISQVEAFNPKVLGNIEVQQL